MNNNVRHCGYQCAFEREHFAVRVLAVSDTYPMFVEPTITWVPSGFSGYIWLDTNKNGVKNKNKIIILGSYRENNQAYQNIGNKISTHQCR